MTLTMTESTTSDDDLPDTQIPSHQLRTTMAAARLSFTWLGTRKSLSAAQKSVAANSFGAEGKYLSAGKKLLDTAHPAFKAVTSVKSRCTAYWKGVSLPYPEPGVRLIRQDTIAAFDNQMAAFRRELREAVDGLNDDYTELKAAARERLGDLFNEVDYPASLIGLFAIEHDYPSVEPPDYLRQLNPDLYEAECRRVQNRFNEAVQLAEQAFVDELARLVDHMTERLSGTTDGKPKVFRDSAVTNLTDFFERFGSLSVRSNEQLDALVSRAHQVVRGVSPQALRDSQGLRQHVATQLASVQGTLDGMLVDRPRRNVIRPSRAEAESA